MFLPCAIGCDGAFLTHSQSQVKVPPQEWVNAFLPRYNRGDLLLHPDNPITVAPQVNEDWLMEIRKHNDEAMKRSKTVIREAYQDFARIFGRDYGNPFFEEYHTDDADVVLVGMGTLSMPVKVAIRRMRQEGKVQVAKAASSRRKRPAMRRFRSKGQVTTTRIARRGSHRKMAAKVSR